MSTSPCAGAFGWAQGPFETWQAAGWKAIAEAVQDDIAAGKAMSARRCRPGCFARDGVHAAEGSYSASANALQARSTLPVYQRQIFPERVLGEKRCRA
jgi:3-hydroxyacyl-CoA dehydrogenase